MKLELIDIQVNVSHIVLHDVDADQPWTTVVATHGTPEVLKNRIELAISEEYCMDDVQIDNITWSSVAMLGFVSWVHEGVYHELKIGYCTVYE